MKLVRSEPHFITTTIKNSTWKASETLFILVQSDSNETKFYLKFQKLVVKVDQLIKRRAQQGLIAVNVDWNGAKEFVKKHINQEFTVSFNMDCLSVDAP